MYSDGKKITKLLYVIVLSEESNAILEKDKFIKDEVISKEYANILEAFVLKKDSTETIIVRPLEDPMHSTSLFGTEIAFFITYIGIKLFSPDLVLSIGYAGEVLLSEDDKPLGLGSVVIAREHSVYHRREMIIKFYENTSQGLYPVLSCEALVKQHGFHSYKVGTSNSFVRLDTIAITKKIKVVEMELCSVARACLYFKTPCIGVKIISDGGNQDTTEEEKVQEFLDSLPLLKRKFFETFEIINNYLLSGNKSVSDL